MEVADGLRGYGTGAPRSPKRTWAENDGRSPTTAFSQHSQTLQSKRLHTLQPGHKRDQHHKKRKNLPIFINSSSTLA